MRVIVSLLSISLITAQAMATDISGVTGSGGVFDINPSGAINGIGFNHYENFHLSEGDIANLIFKYGAENISKFVNFVDNTININGILNTMRDGNFYNGQAIFVSPNGMVVGASGVLNVGSLSVLTPAPCTYKGFTQEMEKYAPILTRPGTPEYEAAMALKGNGTIRIDGTILARNSIDLAAKDVAINSGARLVAGGQETGKPTALSSLEQADVLFNQLVKNGTSSGSAIQNVDGTIKIVSHGTRNDGVTVAEGASVQNFGKGNVQIESAGSGGVNIDGNVSNSNGNTIVKSEQGININGSVKNNNGTLYLENNSAGGIVIGKLAELTNNGITRIKNAGAIFLGEYSSEPLGDYFAGPNHVLPTNGTAKFFSALSVDDFIKKSSIISYSREALEAIHNDIENFASAEHLTAHANSIKVRFE